MLHNAHFREALRLKLAVSSAPSCATCQLVRESGAEDEPIICGEQMETGMLIHPLVCKHSAARLRPHRAICRALGRSMRAAGAQVDYERAIVEHYRWDSSLQRYQEAILDVVLTWPGAVALQAIDVCISCPLAERVPAAAKHAGKAATQAEKRKATRYGADVLPLSFESHGRLGPASQLALDAMARQASAYGQSRCTAGALVRKWRADLELALMFVEADIILQSRGALAACAGPGSYPIGKLLPGNARAAAAAAEASEPSAAPIGSA